MALSSSGDLRHVAAIDEPAAAEDAHRARIDSTRPDDERPEIHASAANVRREARRADVHKDDG